MFNPFSFVKEVWILKLWTLFSGVLTRLFFATKVPESMNSAKTCLLLMQGSALKHFERRATKSKFKKILLIFMIRLYIFHHIELDLELLK